jgi:hypothetical protein
MKSNRCLILLLSIACGGALLHYPTRLFRDINTLSIIIISRGEAAGEVGGVCRGFFPGWRFPLGPGKNRRKRRRRMVE